MYGKLQVLSSSAQQGSVAAAQACPFGAFAPELPAPGAFEVESAACPCSSVAAWSPVGPVAVSMVSPNISLNQLSCLDLRAWLSRISSLATSRKDQSRDLRWQVGQPTRACCLPLCKSQQKLFKSAWGLDTEWIRAVRFHWRTAAPNAVTLNRRSELSARSTCLKASPHQTQRYGH